MGPWHYSDTSLKRFILLLNWKIKPLIMNIYSCYTLIDKLQLTLVLIYKRQYTKSYDINIHPSTHLWLQISYNSSDIWQWQNQLIVNGFSPMIWYQFLHFFDGKCLCLVWNIPVFFKAFKSKMCFGEFNENPSFWNCIEDCSWYVWEKQINII